IKRGRAETRFTRPAEYAVVAGMPALEKLCQNFQHPSRQWQFIRLFRLHPDRRDREDLVGPVDPSPLQGSTFAAAQPAEHEQMRIAFPRVAERLGYPPGFA